MTNPQNSESKNGSNEQMNLFWIEKGTHSLRLEERKGGERHFIIFKFIVRHSKSRGQ